MGGVHLLQILLLLCCATCSVLAQLSNPLASDDQINKDDNKFLQRQPTADSDATFYIDEETLTNSQCPRNLELRWQTEVSASIYSTPLIADINGDGHQEVVVPSFVHYLDVLDGMDGEKHHGWPSFHKSSVHTSPLVHDVDSDGLREVLLATYNGEILFFRHTGELMQEKLVVPRLRVKKDWYVGLAPDPIDHAHPDINDPALQAEELAKQAAAAQHEWGGSHPPTNGSTAQHPPLAVNATAGGGGAAQTPPVGVDASANASPPPIANATAGQGTAGAAAAGGAGAANSIADDCGDSDLCPAKGHLTPAANGSEAVPAVASARRRLLADEDEADDVPTVERDEAGELPEEGVESFDVFREETQEGEEGLGDQYHYDYDDYQREDMWAEENWKEQEHEADEKYVSVDAHVLCTPVVADIDGDGTMELVVAASYFFDREYYEDPKHADELEKGIDIGKYIAGSIVVFNLETRNVKWYVHLDLSTDKTTFRGYIYSPPTVVDLDGDGRLEIVVGTSMGFLYALNSDGSARENFPLQMGEIQGQVVAADVNDDGFVELIAADTRGNVGVFNWRGQEVWERHVASLVAQGATVGDVDGDGRTDVVLGTTSGHIYAFSGIDGKDLRGFPYRTHGRIMAPILLVDLTPANSKSKAAGVAAPGPPVGRTGLDLVVVSFDGYLYVVDGRTGCADVVDVGETSYSMVLADNIDGGDDLDLVVSTMNGNVFCFQTQARYDPIKTWRSQTQGRNLMTVRESHTGVTVLPGSRVSRDIRGQSFKLSFAITDTRWQAPGAGSRSAAWAAEKRTKMGTYNVKVWLLLPGGKVKLHDQVYERPGEYSLKLITPSVRTYAQVVVEMTDESLFYYTDEFALSFHMHFHRPLKWVLVLPLLMMLGVLVTQGSQDGGPELPTVRLHRF